MNLWLNILGGLIEDDYENDTNCDDETWCSELIFLRSLPGSRYCEDLGFYDLSPNFDFSTCNDLLNLPFPPHEVSIISRFAHPNDLSFFYYLLNLPGSGVRLTWRSITSLVTRGMHGWSRGMLIRSLNILVMRCHGPRWPFSSSCTVVETHREPSRSSSQCNHRESDQWHNHNMLGNCQTAEGSNMPRGRVSAKESRQFKASNSLPCEDSETSSMSCHKRKSQEKETHFEEQPTEIQNSNPKRPAVERARRYSSCLSTIIGTIYGNNMCYIPNSITGHDVMDSTHVGVQPSLGSISAKPLNSFSCNESTAKNTKLLFNKLIALSLEDLVEPANETSMKKALSILADHLSLFSEEQAEQILELLFDFPALVHSWREYSRSQMYSQKFFAETEIIRDMLKISVKDEETLKVSYEELENKEKELMRKLEAVQKEKAEIVEQRTEKSKQTKDLISLADEKEAHRNKEDCLIRIATTKLNNLSEQWVKLRSFF